MSLSWIAILCINVIYAQQFFRTNQDYYEYANETGSDFNIMKVAYPINICTKSGSHQDYTQYTLYKCSPSGGLLYGPCEYAIRDTCPQLPAGFNCSQDTLGLPRTITPSADGEQCTDGQYTKSTNYMEISFYCGYTDEQSPAECSSNFTTHGFAKLATNVCVDQGNGNYFMATCDNVSAEIGTYSDSSCISSSYTGPYISYTRDCQKYAFPTFPNGGFCRYFRKVSACFVNGVDILEATQSPTSSPSIDPTMSPSDEPTISPTFYPTDNPTTDTEEPSSSPTMEPSEQPTGEPTFVPSINPTLHPTRPPTTSSPSFAPTQDLSPDVTLPDAQSLLSGLDNISFMYIVFGVMFFFYIFICLYIWCNERRKRNVLTINFQKGLDKEDRIKYLREQNMKRRLELQGISPAANGAMYHGHDNGPGFFEDQRRNYQQMDAASPPPQKKPRDIQHQLMSEGR